MKRTAHRRRAAAVLLLAALLVRAGIPDGYMPAAPGSGLLFELCPSSTPAWFGESSAHSRHHQHAADGSTNAPEADQCPIGHMLSPAAAVDDFRTLNAEQPPPSITAEPALYPRTRVALTYRSRGPPA